jgi:hypothetical protein
MARRRTRTARRRPHAAGVQDAAHTATYATGVYIRVHPRAPCPPPGRQQQPPVRSTTNTGRDPLRGGGGGGGGGALDRNNEPKHSRRQSRAADGCAAGLEPRRTDPNPLEGPHGRVIPDRIDNLHMRWDLGACTRPFCRLWLGSSTAWLLEL